ncbi:MAG: hypothetical protein ABSB76_17770 [Streptosporangiaceae bacterium]|jgi:hypothetical protein
MINPQARQASSGTDPAQSSAAAAGLRARVRQAVRWQRTVEYLAVLLLGLLVLVVHDVGYLLRQPFWNDEAWVAATTRFPLSQLPATTSSTPIGWSVLLRLLTVRGEQTSRLLPLAFAGAAVVIAYWFGRELGWPRREASVAAGLLAGTAVLLVPAMLVRDDLKQYTADACMALLVLALTSRVERKWSRPGLAALSVAVWGGMLFSDASAFVGVAAFGAMCVVQLARRAWRRLAEVAAVGAGTAVLMLGVYEGFDVRATVPGLTAYWSNYYLPVGDGLHADIRFLTSHLSPVVAYFGLGPVWLALPLVLAGLVTIFRLGRPGTALAALVLWPEMLAVSAAKKYPFLDLRTSTFLIAVTVAVAAIGVAGVCSLLRPWFRGTLAAGLAALAVAGFVIGAQPYVRSHNIPNEDVRDQARYVAAHAARGDVIVVNLNSNWGFAYYWPTGVPDRRADPAVLQGYEAYFPDQPDIVVARTRDSAGVDAALSQAVARQHACGRIWLVRTHVTPAEQLAWIAALRQQKLTAAPVGHDGLSVINPGGSRCQ